MGQVHFENITLGCQRQITQCSRVLTIEIQRVLVLTLDMTISSNLYSNTVVLDIKPIARN